jgi:translation initiation factor IF-1
VTGVAESGRLRADSVRLLNDRNPNDGDDRTLTGVVTRDLRGDTFEVRTAAGRTVIVRARETEPVRLTRGDRVFLQGRYNANRGEFVADRIRITENDDRDVEGSRVSFPATVTAVDSATRLQVRGDNGRTYTVDTRAVVSSNVDPGDRVRVSGTIRSGIVRADRIELTDRGTRVPNGRGRLDFSATVIDGGTLWGANVLTVRGDNGREFRVSVPRNSQSNFRRGDRVRVVGIQLEDNRIQATSVTRL